MTDFKNRVFGCAVVKAVNSNYNADFSGQPRTLPSGVVYATDKAFKYTVKNYLKYVYSDKEYVLYFKRYKEEFIPFDLTEAYKEKFRTEVKNDKPEVIARNILSCIDVRIFGATFAPKGDGVKGKSISVHGPVQINHGVNVWKENNIYTEQITSPLRNPDDKKGDKQATTLGRQSKLEEGHYLHHFSVNPLNLRDIVDIAYLKAKEGELNFNDEEIQQLSSEDIEKLKEAMRRGATWYDSASKAGCENEMLVWVQLNSESKIVLPNFSTLIELKSEKEAGKCVYDFALLTAKLKTYSADIESIEVYCNSDTVTVQNTPDGAEVKDI